MALADKVVEAVKSGAVKSSLLWPDAMGA